MIPTHAHSTSATQPGPAGACSPQRTATTPTCAPPTAATRAPLTAASTRPSPTANAAPTAAACPVPLPPATAASPPSVPATPAPTLPSCVMTITNVPWTSVKMDVCIWVAFLCWLCANVRWLQSAIPIPSTARYQWKINV